MEVRSCFLYRFPLKIKKMMLRNGDNTVDAHSLMGFFAIDEKIPIELLLESEPDDNLKQAISKFAFVNA